SCARGLVRPLACDSSLWRPQLAGAAEEAIRALALRRRGVGVAWTPRRRHDGHEDDRHPREREPERGIRSHALDTCGDRASAWARLVSPQASVSRSHSATVSVIFVGGPAGAPSW